MAARPARWRQPPGEGVYRSSPSSSPQKPRNQRPPRQQRGPSQPAGEQAPAPAVPANTEDKPAAAPIAAPPQPRPATGSWLSAATRPPPSPADNKPQPEAQPTPPPAPKSWADMAKKNVSPVTPAPDTKSDPQTGETTDDASAKDTETSDTPETVETQKEETPAVSAPVNPWDKKPAIAQAEKGSLTLEAAEKTELCRRIWELTEEALKAEEIILQPRGLHNIGNLCFMNAVLQGLVGCSAFYRLLHSLSTLKIPKEMKTLYSLITFASEFIHEEAGPVPTPPEGADGSGAQKNAPVPPSTPLQKGVPFTPDYFYDFLSTFSPTDPVRPGRGKARQEDAQEFLTCVLNTVHDELLALMEGEEGAEPRAGSGGADSGEEGAAAEEDDDDWLEVGGKAKTTAVRKMNTRETPITALFGGEFKTTIRFSNSKASASLEPFLCVCLDIKPHEVASLEDALKLYFMPEKLDGVFNDTTRQEGKAHRFVQIAKPPKVLMLNLKRFRFDGATAHKVTKKITYPPTLEIEENFLACSLPHPCLRSYTLNAVVSHHGNKLHSGHYTVHVRQPTGDWIRLDDHSVGRASEQQVLNEQQHAYLLLYQQGREPQA